MNTRLIQVIVMGALCAASATAQASPCDPLMLDLSGDGIALSSSAAGVYFDLHGYVAKTAWTTSNDDGFLAVDVNGNGRIDSGAELFGGSWVKGPGGDGFGSLSPYDIVGGPDGGPDGSITAADPIYTQLVVWFDVNRDGASQSGEIFTLPALGITSLSIVADMSHPTIDAWGNADLGATPTSGKALIHAMIPVQADTGAGHTNATECGEGGGSGGGGTPPPPSPKWHCSVTCNGAITSAGDDWIDNYLEPYVGFDNNNPTYLCSGSYNANGPYFSGAATNSNQLTAQTRAVDACLLNMSTSTVSGTYYFPYSGRGVNGGIFPYLSNVSFCARRTDLPTIADCQLY